MLRGQDLHTHTWTLADAKTIISISGWAILDMGNFRCCFARPAGGPILQPEVTAHSRSS